LISLGVVPDFPNFGNSPIWLEFSDKQRVVMPNHEFAKKVPGEPSQKAYIEKLKARIKN